MKKIYLLVLFASIALTSCKKENNSLKPIDQAIISTVWLTTQEKYEYRNNAGNTISEESPTPGSKYVFYDTKGEVKITDLSGSAITKKYSISTSGGRNFVTIESESTSETYEVLYYTAKEMMWRQEKPIPSAEATVNGATKKVSTLSFHCPCKD